jgi:hypothetical protein
MTHPQPGNTDAMGFIHHQALHFVTKLLEIQNETSPWALPLN